jgi:FkbM family methyltransferase
MSNFLKRWAGAFSRQDVPPPSVEFATAEDIRACFRLLLGREPNPEEWPGHSSRTGDKLSAVVRSFLSSKEFADRRLLEADDLSAYEFAPVAGFRVAASPNDIDVGKHLLPAGQYEPHVTRVFERELREGMRVVDIGANCGYFSFLTLARVGSGGHVWAIEPNPANVRLLEISKRANGVRNLTIILAAAGVGFGTMRLSAAQSNGTVSPLAETAEEISAATLVCQIALDAIFPGDAAPPDFIKIDVEGAEYVALKGFERTLQRSRPKIVSEFSPGTMPGISGVTGADYLGFLLTMGYRIGVIDREGQVDRFHLSPPPILEAFARSGVDHIDLFAIPS